MIKLVLIRHGQSTWNLENRFTGWVDVGLSDLGKQEAHSAATLLLLASAGGCSESTSEFQPVSDSPDPSGVKVVIEIPDLLDLDAADQKYTGPLRLLLAEHHAGSIVGVEQGKPKTPEEFSRIITLELREYDTGLDLVQQFLAETQAPVGTMLISYHANGENRDIFILGPER